MEFSPPPILETVVKNAELILIVGTRSGHFFVCASAIPLDEWLHLNPVQDPGSYGDDKETVTLVQTRTGVDIRLDAVESLRAGNVPSDVDPGPLQMV